MNWVIAFAICVAAAFAETLFAGKDVTQKMRGLRQPSWSLPFGAWIAIGLFYYAACFYALAQLFETGSPRTAGEVTALTLLLAIMATNAAWNGLFFRAANYKASFLLFFPYATAIAALIVLLIGISFAAAIVFAAYAAYFFYALPWTYSVWRMNEAR